MLKTLCTLFACCVFLSACGTAAPPASSATATESPSASSVAPSSSVSSTPESSVPAVPKAELDTAMTEALSTSILEGFGDPQYGASWYKYIDRYEVYKQGTEYYGELYLTEAPSDYKIRLFFSSQLSENNLNVLIPPVLDAAAALELDETDCLILAGDLIGILNSTTGNPALFYALSSMGVPVDRYLASAYEVSEATIRESYDQLDGHTAAGVIAMGMSEQFAGSFQGLTTEKIETIVRVGFSGIDDIYLTDISVYDPDGNLLDKFENLRPRE